MTTTTTKTVRFLGACKACKRTGRPHGVRTEATVTTTRTETRTVAANGAEGWPVIKRRYAIAIPGERVFYTSELGGASIACPRCSADVLVRPVVGTKNETKCGARCRNSTGPSCECSCGGANHGCGH